MDTALPADGRLYTILQRVDEDLAHEQRPHDCLDYGTALQWASYSREPRGVQPARPLWPTIAPVLALARRRAAAAGLGHARAAGVGMYQPRGTARAATACARHRLP